MAPKPGTKPMRLRPHHLLDIVTEYKPDEDPAYVPAPGENGVRTIARLLQRDDLGMRPSDAPMITPADNLTVFHDDGSNQRVRADAAFAFPREAKSLTHHPFVEIMTCFQTTPPRICPAKREGHPLPSRRLLCILREAAALPLSKRQFRLWLFHPSS